MWPHWSKLSGGGTNSLYSVLRPWSLCLQCPYFKSLTTISTERKIMGCISRFRRRTSMDRTQLFSGVLKIKNWTRNFKDNIPKTVMWQSWSKSTKNSIWESSTTGILTSWLPTAVKTNYFTRPSRARRWSRATTAAAASKHSLTSTFMRRGTYFHLVKKSNHLIILESV